MSGIRYICSGKTIAPLRTQSSQKRVENKLNKFSAFSAPSAVNTSSWKTKRKNFTSKPTAAR